MIISDEEIERRLNSPENMDYKIIPYSRGRQGGEVSVPPELRKVVAILAHESNETQKELGDTFGMTGSRVSQLKSGKVTSGTFASQDENLTGVLNEVKARKENKRSEAEEMALNNLIDSLGLLPAKLEKANAKTLASAAKSMADVADRMSGRKNEEEKNQVHLHLYAPHMKELSDYEVVEGGVVK